MIYTLCDAKLFNRLKVCAFFFDSWIMPSYKNSHFYKSKSSFYSWKYTEACSELGKPVSATLYCSNTKMSQRCDLLATLSNLTGLGVEPESSLKPDIRAQGQNIRAQRSKYAICANSFVLWKIMRNQRNKLD